MSQISILIHLGLGDAIICCGLIRHYAEQYEKVKIPVYSHNYNTVAFMFRDNKKIELHPVESSQQADDSFNGKDCIRLGFYSKQPFNRNEFDIEFYRQANVPFENRWNKFHVIMEERTVSIDDRPTAFVHEDFGRSFLIRKELVKLPIITPIKGGRFFDNYSMMKNCEEIHCINSSFLHFWDSIPHLEGQKLFYHKYARKGDEPKLKKAWEIL